MLHQVGVSFDLYYEARKHKITSFDGCLTVHLLREIKWNANLMQLGNFIDVFLARHVSGTYAHHQEHQMLSCSIWSSAPSLWMGGGTDSRRVGRVLTCCNLTSGAPDDGRMCPKHVELRKLQ